MNGKHLQEIGRLAVVMHEAIKDRTRAHIAAVKLLRAWTEETGEFFDRDTCDDVEGAEEIIAATEAKKAAQIRVHRARAALRAAINRAQKGGKP